MLCCAEADIRESSRDNRDVDIDDASYDIHVPGRVVLNLWRILTWKVDAVLIHHRRLNISFPPSLPVSYFFPFPPQPPPF